MKNIIKYLFFSFLLTTIVWSCKKDEKKIYFEGGTAPVLSANKTALVLTDATKDNEAIKFTWTNPNYQFTTGISSQNVYYILEIDTTGANFTNPNKQSIAITNDLSQTFTVGSINATLSNGLLLKTGMSHNVEFRIKATLINNAVPIYSNVLKITATPFMPPPKVEPPAEGTLWILGDATLGGWDNPMKSPYDVTQKFTRVSNTLYVWTGTLKAVSGGGYKLIQKQGNWGSQFHAIDGTVFTGGDFEQKDAEPKFPAPATTGTYKVTIDFQLGKYFVSKQ